MRRHTLPLAALVLLLAGLPVGAAPPADKVPLALVPAPGKVIAFVKVTGTEKTNALLESARKALGKDTADRHGLEEEFSLEIREALPEGGFAATVRFGRITATLKDLMGKPLEVRSDRTLPKDPMLGLSAPQLIAPGGSEFTAVLDAGGVLKSIETPKDLEAKRAKVLGLGKDGSVFLMLGLAAPALPARLNHPLAGTPLPEDPVGPGDGWNASPSFLDAVSGGTLLLRQVFKVAGVTEGEVRLEGKGAVEVDRTVLPKGMKEEFDLGESRVTGSKVSTTLRLSRADGLPLAGSGEASWEIEEKSSRSGSPRKSKTKATWKLERVEKWPSGMPVGGAGK